MNYSGRKKQVKDERIIKEMNQIKGYVLGYVFIATLILVILKLLMRFEQLEYFYVEIFVVLLSAITFGIVVVLKSSDLDERIEAKVKQTYQISYVFLMVGGLWVHFYQVLTNFAQMQVSIYITNTLILIGFIVTIVLLKRKGLYANYKFIEHDKKTYYKHIFFIVFLMFITFVVIYATTRLAVGSQVGDLILNMYSLILALSFLMISIEYLIFSIYEKNHFDEMILFEKGKPNHLSKNVFVFHVILFFYTIVTAYINFRFQLVLISDDVSEHIEQLKFWSAISRSTQIMSIDPIILSLITSLILYYFLKKLIGSHMVLRLYYWFIWIGFITSLLTYLFNLSIPLISIANTSEGVMNIMNIYNNISLGISITSTIAKVGFMVFLIIKNIKFKWILSSYLLLTVIMSYPLRNYIMPFDSIVMKYIGLGITIVSGLIYLGLLWLYSHEPYLDYKQKMTDDNIYESTLVET
jgi:hypothetical protein